MQSTARRILQGFTRASFLAVALTALLLFLLTPARTGLGQEAAGKAAVVSATREAASTLHGLWHAFVANLPRFAVVLAVLVVAGGLSRLVRPAVRRVLGHWPRADAVSAILGVTVWLLALGVAASVLVGDIRALVGSVGLVGLALSWALQTPIESFTGWLLNSFHGYFRVGDRIAVGEVYGDVYRIDLLTTTVWEYGGGDRPPGEIHAEQPTGRLITFPNNEVLSGSIVNYTRDFPYVWDELEVPVANESELRYAVDVVERVAREVVGELMVGPAREYEAILRRARMDFVVADQPTVYVSLAESWTTLTVRYLVGAREKRRWKSDLALRVMEELGRPEHRGRIVPAYPRRQVQLLSPDGVPAPFPAPPRAPG